jgi:hypothetical protein
MAGGLSSEGLLADKGITETRSGSVIAHRAGGDSRLMACLLRLSILGAVCHVISEGDAHEQYSLRWSGASQKAT